IALAVGQGLAGRPPHRTQVGRRVGRAAVSATMAALVLWLCLVRMEPHGTRDLFEFAFILFNAYVLTALYAAGLEVVRPLGDRLRSWIAPERLERRAGEP